MSARDLWPGLALLALIALLPFVASNTALNFLLSVLIVALAAQGWNILGGYAGQLSFGHAAFFGTGAYATAILQLRFGVNAWIGLAAGIALGALVGWAIGALSFRARLRGSYFALVTLAFAEVLRILANAADVTGGAAGLLIRLSPGVANLQFPSRAVFLWLVAATVAGVLVLTAWIARGRFGAQLVAVRENEDAARALGVDVLGVKLRAIALSGAITAAAGCLYAQNFLYLDANIAYGTWISVEVLIACVLGGAGTVLGPVLGALALHGVGEIAKIALGHIVGPVPGVDLIVFGALLVLAIAFLPRGVMGGLRRLGQGLAR
ncbi:branched-chain amino acid ABC transporter permease [Pararoseomonas indoligenes]|uniref:Branched-chain amino acid ABC transporter permease n=1 Tax=Roseomonas indoligenes TaxID=2820811 RepID=A0A940S7E5_9PROT|nr:branched-chain amino acid ABC transporter permease [Pararoseomonas indoligenes]MBP0494860.1 branched-chain amino acid ABC transporter permease [Pararoseomonas indoligenes]